MTQIDIIITFKDKSTAVKKKSTYIKINDKYVAFIDENQQYQAYAMINITEIEFC